MRGLFQMHSVRPDEPVDFQSVSAMSNYEDPGPTTQSHSRSRLQLSGGGARTGVETKDPCIRGGIISLPIFLGSLLQDSSSTSESGGRCSASSSQLEPVQVRTDTAAGLVHHRLLL